MIYAATASKKDKRESTRYRRTSLPLHGPYSHTGQCQNADSCRLAALIMSAGSAAEPGFLPFKEQFGNVLLPPKPYYQAK